MTRRLAAAALVTAFVSFSFSAHAVQIATHRAFYSLSMAAASSDSGISDVGGAMTFEWADSCDGWTVEQRYVMRFLRTDGSEVEVATTYVTWESKDGLKYRFNVKRTTNGTETELVKGTASLDAKGGPGMARFEQPAEDNIALSAGTIFPTEHSIVLIEEAQAGTRFDRHVVFDGSEAEGAAPVTTVILPQRDAPLSDAMAEPLGPHPVWPMQLAFYAPEGTAGPGEELPDFELSMDIQANGIVTGLTLGFNGFKVKGTLERVEAVPAPAC